MALISSQWLDDIYKQEVPTGTIDGVNTDFTLSILPHSEDATFVYINGVIQRLGVDFTISTQTITFTNPPIIGQSVYVVYIKGVL